MLRQLGISAFESSWKDYSAKKLDSFKAGLHPVTFTNKLHRVLKELRKPFLHFLWSGKGNKIKRNVMIGDSSDGGLKMIDLELFNKALKSTWVKKYLDPENHGK